MYPAVDLDAIRRTVYVYMVNKQNRDMVYMRATPPTDSQMVKIDKINMKKAARALLV